jgi:hypothetical protein
MHRSQLIGHTTPLSYHNMHGMTKTSIVFRKHSLSKTRHVVSTLEMAEKALITVS